MKNKTVNENVMCSQVKLLLAKWKNSNETKRSFPRSHFWFCGSQNHTKLWEKPFKRFDLMSFLECYKYTLEFWITEAWKKFSQNRCLNHVLANLLKQFLLVVLLKLNFYTCSMPSFVISFLPVEVFLSTYDCSQAEVEQYKWIVFMRKMKESKLSPRQQIV